MLLFHCFDTHDTSLHNVELIPQNFSSYKQFILTLIVKVFTTISMKHNLKNIITILGTLHMEFLTFSHLIW